MTALDMLAKEIEAEKLKILIFEHSPDTRTGNMVFNLIRRCDVHSISDFMKKPLNYWLGRDRVGDKTFNVIASVYADCKDGGK